MRTERNCRLRVLSTGYVRREAVRILDPEMMSQNLAQVPAQIMFNKYLLND